MSTDTIDTKALLPVTHAEAREILGRFNNSHWFNRADHQVGDREVARYSIPANSERDDDLRLAQYIEQNEAAADRLAALEAENGRLEAMVLRAADILDAIHSMAHDLSTGPAVPDGYWELRQMAGLSLAPAAPNETDNAAANGDAK